MPEQKNKKQCIFLGSVPMSLEELPLAPAVVCSHVKKLGHNFEFFDSNLDLFESCKKNYDLYYEKVEILQNWKYSHTDTLLEQWFAKVLQTIQKFDVVLINVFSSLSQPAAYRFCQLAKQLKPHITIVIGGIGSYKKLNNSSDSDTIDWINQTFSNTQSFVYGELLYNNGLADFWQTKVGTDVLDSALPNISDNTYNQDFDFSIYDIRRYQWNAQAIPLVGSYGCVRKCSFCDVIVHFPKYSFIEADHLTKQILKAYDDTGIGKVQFMDSLVNGSMKNFEALLRNLAHSKMQGWLPDDFGWSGTYICRKPSIQLDRIHDLLPLSGADNLVIGVESGSDEIRFGMQKKFTNADLIYELQAFRIRNIKTTLLFFPAWPLEKLEHFNETLNLFHQLSEFAQSGTIDSVSLSTFGYSLLEGTPLYDQKEEIGLEPGPTPWLWHCRENPNLNFWEAIRRRLLAVEVAEYYGIAVSLESLSRRQLNTSLALTASIIKEYAGRLKFDIMDFSTTLNALPNLHNISFEIINSGHKDVTIFVNAFDKKHSQKCSPGKTIITIATKKIFNKEQNFLISIRFADDYVESWDRHPGGEFYSQSGVYIDNIFIDSRDITLKGFNQTFKQTILCKEKLPPNYYSSKINQRCVALDTDLQMQVPAGQSLHHHIWCSVNPELHNERLIVNKKLQKNLQNFL